MDPTNEDTVKLCDDGSLQSPLPRQLLRELIEGILPIQPDRLFLFGSAVEQGIEADDVDLFVLAEAFNGVRFDLRRSLLALPEEPYVDTWLYTQEEFEELYPEGSRFREEFEETKLDLHRFIED
ncbi:hypothetical protein [Halobacterium wangiae]|uniref:hypothetical protein n=1 Tax=Halobacterium wangiae TaxID=2902623 RepID=UPI001E5BC091|nr:hypothetical protein [Halobacterium wangiae]